MSRWSTRVRLIVLMTIVALGAVLGMAAVTLAIEVPRARAALGDEIGSLARLVGNRSSAALVFGDAETAGENLRALASLGHVGQACLFDASGVIVSTMAPAAQSPCAPATPLRSTHGGRDGLRIWVQHPVEHFGTVVGAVQVWSTEAPLRSRFTLQAGALAAALAVALVLALALSIRLQRHVSGPIASVRSVAEAIIERGDTSLRAPSLGDNEIGRLAEAFNRMLDTVRRQTDDLAQREAYGRRLFHESQGAQLVFNAHGHCVDCNRAAQSLFGRNDLVGLHSRQLLADDELPLLPEASPVQASVGLEARMRRADGSAWQASVDLVPFELDGTSLVHATVQDVSALREAEAARSARIAAEAANQAKTDFLSRMSHELRTPLNAALGCLQLLGRDAAARLSHADRRHLELATKAGQHLRLLVDDSLDIARIEAGRIDLIMTAVPLAPLADSVVDLCQGQANEAAVVLQRGAWLPVVAHADERRLRQILLNLVSNAIKYNRRGGHVRLDIGTDERGPFVEVGDDGIGMSAEQLARAFEPFNRLGRERSTVPGTGIGLALSRQLADLMNGSIELSSAAEVGTRARLRLRPANEASAPAVASDPRPAQVLYVEDEPVNRILVERCLAAAPEITLRLAETGGEALAQLQSAPHDLLLLDMHLPDMSGLELLGHMETLPSEHRPPVVVMSASRLPEEIRQAHTAGAIDYWEKPVDMARFADDVRSLLARSRA